MQEIQVISKNSRTLDPISRNPPCPDAKITYGTVCEESLITIIALCIGNRCSNDVLQSSLQIRRIARLQYDHAAFVGCLELVIQAGKQSAQRRDIGSNSDQSGGDTPIKTKPLHVRRVKQSPSFGGVARTSVVMFLSQKRIRLAVHQRPHLREYPWRQ